MIEAPALLQSPNYLSISPDHFEVCKVQDIPTVGNAAGNSQDFLDLTGAPRSPDPLPDGFTAKGIVALVFSILAACLGMAVISWWVPCLVSSRLLLSGAHSYLSPSDLYPSMTSWS